MTGAAPRSLSHPREARHPIAGGGGNRQDEDVMKNFMDANKDSRRKRLAAARDLLKCRHSSNSLALSVGRPNPAKFQSTDRLPKTRQHWRDRGGICAASSREPGRCACGRATLFVPIPMVPPHLLFLSPAAFVTARRSSSGGTSVLMPRLSKNSRSASSITATADVRPFRRTNSSTKARMGQTEAPRDHSTPFKRQSTQSKQKGYWSPTSRQSKTL